jgi:hypothetical protein
MRRFDFPEGFRSSEGLRRQNQRGKLAENRKRARGLFVAEIQKVVMTVSRVCFREDG